MADIKLFRPQRLTDNPDGGGLATATEIVDGEVNNLFDDISRIDRVNGELSLRKAFAIAATADTELYSDVHLIVAAPPLDPRVSAVLFRTSAWDDERADAQAAVERYLDESVISRMIPYDRQLAGQRTVLVYQRPELSLPEIGEVYALKNDTSGDVEFIRVQDVDHEVQTFTDGNGDYRARVITLTITQPLSKEFSGSQPSRYFTAESGKSVVRKTIASDAARYKGVVVLAEDAAIGDLSVKVDTIFAQLVPAATTEVPVTDATPDGATLYVPSADAAIPLLSFTVTVDAPANLHLPAASVQGSVVLDMPIAGARWEEHDDGTFLLTVGSRPQVVTMTQRDWLHSDPGLPAKVGTVNGIPAAPVAKASNSYLIPVEIQNRGYVYTASLHPAPAPGTTRLSFRAQGKWYALEDDGTGALVGEPGVGTGLINFATGSLQATLGALPDVGSAVVIGWGGSTEYEIRTGDTAINPPEVRRVVPEGNIEPGSFSVSWTAGGATKTATDDGAGNLTGDGIGRVVYSTGEYALRPSLLPDPTTEYVASYDAGAIQQEDFTPSMSGGVVSLQASTFPLRPGSVAIDYTNIASSPLHTYTRARRLTDDGAGGLLDEQGNTLPGATVNYTTGLISFTPNFQAYVPSVVYGSFSNAVPGRVVATDTNRYPVMTLPGEWVTAWDQVVQTVPFVDGTAVHLTYKPDSAVDAAATDTAPAQPLVLDLLPTTGNSVVPSGLLFVLAGKTYYDRSGTLYHSIDPLTGAGTAAGTIDYAGGVATLTSWTGGTAPALSIKALLTQIAALPLAVIHGRAPGSPLRPNTFFLQANRYRDGALVTGLADNNGNISTAAMHGTVDVTTGVFSVAFGAYVLDSALTSEDKAEPWYNVSNVDEDGYIWRPDEVIPGSVRFNCVVQSSLPLDPAIIKVNPVRLPMDGRVPVLRAGDTLVISDPQPYTLPSPLTAGQVVTLPRTDLDSVALYDANGLGVPASLFAADLAAGTVTMADPLDLSGYAEPLVAIHTVEDMAACLDAQITGRLTLSAPLSHAYTADQSLVSSALILGDAQARYEHLFAQNTWTSVWSDSLIGSAPTGGAQYNDALYPIEVKNADAVTQRWRLSFTSSTAYQVVGETMGVIATGTTSADCAPINPATGLPYFTIRAAGFGSGWSTGNQLRFNTVAAGGPVWVARTVLSGPATQQDDRVRIGVRWDKD